MFYILLSILIVSLLVNLAFIWTDFSRWLIEKITYRTQRAELCPWCHRSLRVYFIVKRNEPRP